MPTPKPDLTDEERRYYARVEARASRLVAELRERVAAGEDLPTEGAFLIRVRELIEAIGDADDITIGKRDVALFAELAATMALETAAESIADDPATPRSGTCTDSEPIGDLSGRSRRASGYRKIPP